MVANSVDGSLEERPMQNDFVVDVLLGKGRKIKRTCFEDLAL